MPRLTKKQALEVSKMSPFALNCAISHQTLEILCINHWDVDQVVARFAGEEPKLYKVQTERGGNERLFFSDGHNRYYLDEFVRYDSPWIGNQAI